MFSQDDCRMKIYTALASAYLAVPLSAANV